MIAAMRRRGALTLLSVLCMVVTIVPAQRVQAGGLEARYAWQVPGSIASTGDRVVALTFDDGPTPYTSQILDILAREGVPATFFAVGSQVERYPDLVRRAAEEGHAVMGHTQTHAYLTRVADAGYGFEVDRPNSLIASITGKSVGCVRPPYGAVNGTVIDRLGRRGLTTAMWSVDPSDYRRPGADTIAARVLGGLTPGAVVAMHDGGGDRSQTVAALPAIIAGARARGYGFVSMCGESFNAPVHPRVFPFGSANAGGIADPGPGFTSSRPVVGMAATPSGNGYWLVAADGGIFGFGDARFFGSTGGQRLNRPVVGMAVTPSGDGYWLVAADGGIFGFGDARFFGSTGGQRLNRPVVGMAASTAGYWLIAEDGGVFAFGDAGFHGSRGGLDPKDRYVAMIASPDRSGYRLAGHRLAG